MSTEVLDQPVASAWMKMKFGRAVAAVVAAAAGFAVSVFASSAASFGD
jgi:hypothetical protein